MIERALPTEAVCAYRMATVQLAHLGRKEDAEGLLLAHLARHPQAETAADVAEVRWRIRDDAGAADILAHPPASLTRRDFREIGERFADVFRSRPAAEMVILRCEAGYALGIVDGAGQITRSQGHSCTVHGD